MTTSFNLMTEPWIAVRRSDDGSLEEVSIRDALANASSYRGLAGEITMQDMAVLRLLLAILYRATFALRREDEAVRLWGKWWQASGLPMDLIDPYLARYADRFDLFDPERPFFQVAGLHTASGSTSGLVKLIAEVPAGAKFFTVRDGAGVASLSKAEAARWLVALHACDISGIKTGAVGDERVSGGKGYPIGTGITGALGLTIVEGNSLRETLLLNLVLPMGSETDSVPWERAPDEASESWVHPVPTGTADLYTWQSRRCRLICGAGAVTDVLVCNGDKLGPQNLHILEPLSSWRFSEPQTKALGATTFMPRTHDPKRSIWRGLGPLLTREVEDRKPIRPRVFDWLATLRAGGALPRDGMVSIRTVGLEYGPKGSSVAGAVDDALPVAVSLLSDPVLAKVATDAAEVAQRAVIALANLAANLAKAGGVQDQGRRDAAFEAGYASLDPLFRRWIRGIRSEVEPDDLTASWQLAVRRALADVGADLCSQAGSSAVSGRVDQTTGELMDVPRAWNLFLWKLRKETPAAECQAEEHLQPISTSEGTEETHD